MSRRGFNIRDRAPGASGGRASAAIAAGPETSVPLLAEDRAASPVGSSSPGGTGATVAASPGDLARASGGGAASIALCMIVRDEARTLERCLASVRPHVAEVCVLDTGSTDGTLELLDRLAGEPGPPLRVERGEWRNNFAWARNRSFAMASPDVRWLLYLDADDELEGGERLADVAAALESTGGLAAAIGYEIETAGVHAYLRVFRVGSGHWRGAVHEGWYFTDAPTRQAELMLDRIVAVRPSLMRVRHRREDNQPGRYLSRLRRAAADTVTTPRALFWLGRELASLGEHDEAVGTFRAYLAAGVHEAEGPWTTFRLEALNRLASSAIEAGGFEDALTAAREGHAYLAAWAEAARNDPHVPRPSATAAFADYAAAALFALGVPDGAETISDDDLIRAADEIIETLTETVRVRAARRALAHKAAATGRNKPCPCGSGLKFKRCCGDRSPVIA